jgi:PAS domain S-box-containing protein
VNVPLRVLLVEDSEADVLLLVRELRRGGFEPSYERVASAADLSAALDRQSWDLILADHAMPQFSDAAALRLVRGRGLDVPFICVSGSISEEDAVLAMKAGANDYLAKSSLKRLVPAIERELREARGRQARQTAEAQGRRSMERLQAVLASSLDAVITMNADGVVTEWNAQAETIFGWPWADAVGHVLSDLIIPAEHREAHRRGLARFLATGEGPLLRRRIEVMALHHNGSEFPVELTISPVRLGDTWEFSAFVRDLSERKRTEAALRELEQSQAALVAHAPVGIYRSNPAGRFLSANAALVRMLGYDSTAEVLALDMARDVYVDPAERRRLVDLDADNRDVYDDLETTWKRKDGRHLRVQLSVRSMRGPDRQVTYYETFVRDVTEQRRLQQQLAQAQKMEAIGRLAGGIAHDFNNLLTVILSNSEMVLEALPAGDPNRPDVDDVRRAAMGAASLTRQLLAFSRQQVLELQVVDLNAVIRNLEKMMRRVIGEDIEVATQLAADLGVVRADVGQLEQVLMNLAANARDAMPAGGKLTIETANLHVGAEVTRQFDAPPLGLSVMLAVSDTGVGMDEATKARIFEPFFTTKELGRGTGLGLATVYGIVKQLRGFILTYSEPAQGTTFKIYLPRVEAEAPVASTTAEPKEPQRGTETVLLVEDAPQVRAVTRQVLERLGYVVLDAPNAETALQIAEQHRAPIHLLLTDVVMPGLSGRELADRLMPMRPEIKVLFVSGYTNDATLRRGILTSGMAYLQKPFTPHALAQKIRSLLDARGTEPIG